MANAPLVLATMLACSVAAAAPAATSADPLQSRECRQALAALHEEEAASALSASAPAMAAASSPAIRAASAATIGRGGRATLAIDPRLAAARASAARSCLASRADPPVAGRLARQPVVVPPVAGARAPLPVASAPGAVSVPRLPGPAPLVSITSCDAAGCWASDGSRLNRVGPTLWGSRGACSVQGSVVQCP